MNDVFISEKLHKECQTNLHHRISNVDRKLWAIIIMILGTLITVIFRGG